MDLELVSRIATRAAYRAGRVLNDRFGKIIQISKKGAIDLVTEADIESEQAIITTIREVFPEHAILAEESGLLDLPGQYRWIIDPLDGTTNFTHGVALYSISIAFLQDSEILVGLVFVPSSGELFLAQKGQGARLNNAPLNVSATAQLNESLLVTGFPYSAPERINPLLERFKNCILASQGVRRLGSAAIDLCYVASGRFEGFWEEGLNPWDTAAGILIVNEAGGRVTDFEDQPFQLDNQQLLATNGLIHKEMIQVLTREEPHG
jgi:myo-inositol-1(or 4)-monophosphatase